MKIKKIEPQLKYKMFCGKNKDHKSFKGVGGELSEMWRCKICKIPVEWELIGVMGRRFKTNVFFKDLKDRKYGTT